jgi:hypothetical protein
MAAKATAPAVARRVFLRRAIGRQRTVTLACDRLYVRYVDALAAGDLESFVHAVQREIGAADHVILAERQWLARDDFRDVLARALTRTVREPTTR